MHSVPPALLSVNSYYYRRGGAEVVFFEHNRLLAEAGWTVAPFSMQHSRNIASDWEEYFPEEVELGETVGWTQRVRKAGKAVYSFESRRKISALIRALKPDICHAHNVYHHLSPSIFSAIKRMSIPIVLTLHDLKIACPAYSMLSSGSICERCKNGQLYRVAQHRCIKGKLSLSALVMLESYLHRFLGSYVKNVDTFIVPSRFYLEKFVEWGFERDSFRYIPNFVDLRAFEPCYKPGKRFVYLGRLSVEKGVHTLIRAAAEAKVGVTIVGAGPQERELRELADSSAADVIFEGYRSGAELHNILQGARALVLPSEWHENAPIGVLEAYALGKPVIGSESGGIPELITDGETGYRFETGSVENLALRLTEVAAATDQIIEQIGRECRRVVEENFSQSQYLSNILALYRDLGVRC